MMCRRAGIPTVGIGPLFASNYNYDGKKEHLPLAEFEDGLEHCRLLIRALARQAVAGSVPSTP